MTEQITEANAGELEAGKLLPCPFCGSEAEFARDDDEDGGFVAVQCTGCGCGSGKHYPIMDSADSHASGEWNRRPSLQPSSAADAKPVAWPTREEVARAADPAAFLFQEGELDMKTFDHVRGRAYRTADAVMALYAQPQPSQQAGAEGPKKVTVLKSAIERLILAADMYGVAHLDSDDMDDDAVELQDATESMKDILAALQPSSAADAKPVAWRWRFSAEDAWHFGDKEPGKFRFGQPDDIEPLYAQPHPSQQAGPDLVSDMASLRALGISHATHGEPTSQRAGAEGERDYPAEFEAWWATYRHRNVDHAPYPVKKQIAFDAFYFAALKPVEG